MTDMESLERAVEEAREKVINEMINYATARIGVGSAFFHDALDDLEAAVSERARAEERERAEESFKPLAEEYRRIVARNARPPIESARSSEEGGNG